MSNAVFLSYPSLFHLFYNHSYHKVWWKSFDAYLSDANIIVFLFIAIFGFELGT